MTDRPVQTDGQLDAVSRTVTATRHDDTVDTVATISQSYRTDADDLWDACTTAERLARWFGPVSGDLRLGGEYQIENNAHGTVTACTPPRTFTLTWELYGPPTTLVVTVEPDGDDCARLTLEHSGSLDAGLWDQFGPGAVGIGWDLGLVGLAHHLATGSDTPAESTGWVGTASGREFMAGSSRRWADASIAAGTSEADARSAQERTSAMFLGG